MALKPRISPSGPLNSGSGGSQTLEDTLEEGNTTGSLPILVSENSYLGSEEGQPLTIAASTDLALAANGGMFLNTLSGGAVNIHAGGSDSSPLADLIMHTADVGGGANSGRVFCKSGDATLSGISGEVQVVSGDTVSGNSGEFIAGSGESSSGVSGNVLLASGDSTTGDSGDLIVRTGAAPGGTRGELTIGGRILTLEVDGTEYRLPAVDGTAGQVLSTDGNGNLSWITP